MSSLTINQPGLQPPLDTHAPSNVKTGVPATGLGTTGQVGSVPDSEPAFGTSPPGTNALMQSLVALMPSISADAVDVAMAEVVALMKDFQSKSDKEGITAQQGAKHAALMEKQDKLNEASKKILDAIYKEEHASIWDKIKMAFEALGAILAIVLGAILIATGVGAVAGGLLIAAGVVGLIMVIDEVVKATSPDHLGIAGSIAKATGSSPEDCAKADMGFEISMAIIGILLAVATLVEGGGGFVAIAGTLSKLAETAKAVDEFAETAVEVEEVVATGTEVAETSSEMAETAETAETVAKTANETLSKAQTIGNYVSTATTVGTAIISVGTAAVNYEATTLRADAKDLSAKAKEMEALIQIMDDLIDGALTRLMASTKRFDDMLDGIMSGIKDKADTMSHAKLRA